MVMSKRAKKIWRRLKSPEFRFLVLDQGINEIVRKGLSSLVMLGESLENPVIPTPILQHLRGSLNEIGFRVGTMKTEGGSWSTFHALHDQVHGSR